MFIKINTHHAPITDVCETALIGSALYIGIIFAMEQFIASTWPCVTLVVQVTTDVRMGSAWSDRQSAINPFAEVAAMKMMDGKQE